LESNVVQSRDLFGQVASRKRVRPNARPTSRTSLAREVGPLVYYCRIDGLIKIGTTSNLADRCRAYGGWSSVLAIEPGGRAVESARLAEFADDLARGQEFFYPSAALLTHVNALRAAAGGSPIAA
jgi:hypothetical protein